MKIIYHLCPIEYYEAASDQSDYTPSEYAREGFIHCTRGAEQVVIVANRYYRNDARPFCVFVIAENLLTAQLKNEPAADGLLYPHLYGPLNRTAILKVVPLPRLSDGTFQLPEGGLLAG
jgi:uncharacterized protein (DUF952 family)